MLYRITFNLHHPFILTFQVSNNVSREDRFKGFNQAGAAQQLQTTSLVTWFLSWAELPVHGASPLPSYVQGLWCPSHLPLALLMESEWSTYLYSNIWEGSTVFQSPTAHLFHSSLLEKLQNTALPVTTGCSSPVLSCEIPAQEGLTGWALSKQDLLGAQQHI